MNLESAFQKVKTFLPLFYCDKLNVRRMIKVKNADGSVGWQLSEPIYSNIDCSISYKVIDNPNPEDVAKNPQISVLEIFLDVDVNIQKGDTITAYKYNSDKTTVLSTYEGLSNEPNKYPTHQQIRLSEVGNA